MKNVVRHKPKSVSVIGLFCGALVLLSGQANAAATPWVGTTGITETVDIIMARQRQAAAQGPGPERNRPPLRADRQGLSQNPKSPAAPAVQSSPSGFVPLAAQTTGTSFTAATLADTSSFPPDTMGAVGPTQFIVAVNGRIRTFNKTTGAADGALDASMDTFFNSVMTPPVGTNFTSDPHIRYDRLSGRWFVIIIDVPGGSGALPNRVLLAVSSGGTITSSSSFTFFYFQHDTVAPAGDTNNFADYPTLGIDINALYIGDNVFTAAGSFAGCSAFVVRKSSILGAGPIVVTALRGLVPNSSSDGPYTPQGVDNYDPAATEGYFIGVSSISYGKLIVRRVSDPGGTPTVSGNLEITVPATASPITVPHLGGTGGSNGRLDAVDDRLFAAHLRNGRLWTAHNIQVDATGAASTTGGRDGSRWYELQNLNTTPALIQSGTIFDSAASNPKFYWIPTIMVSGQGHVAMGFSTAGSAYRANAGYTGRLSGDALNTMQAPLDYTASSTAYNPPSDHGGPSGRRWGDFSFTSLDPNDDMTMWTIQEFCDATNSYGVRAVKLIAPPPATPASCSPASVVLGQSSVAVTVTGTAVSGAGFFDPGAGFANRLAGAVTGGVVVNSVTYNSPTSVTLNLNTTASTAGTRDVTLTNPDGQSLTGVGILTVTKIPQTITFAGPGDQPFSFSPLALSATASSGLTVSFSIVSGPATISGSNLTMTGTGLVTVRASQSGDASYLAAPDVDRSFTITPDFASWQNSKFTSAELADANISGPNAVYGLDGLSNLVKYALGLEPKANITTGLPGVTVVDPDWVFTYVRPTGLTDITYAVQVSPDLTTWTTAGVTHELVSSSGGFETWRGRYPLASATNAFFRLNVTQP